MTDPALSKSLAMIADFEGFCPDPYRDVGGVWTIGYGFTYLPGMVRVTEHTPPMTEEAGLAWLQIFVTKTLASVRQMVHVNATNNQIASLTSFAYNEGTAALRGSTLMLRFNEGNVTEAADCFMSWVYADGKQNDGLRNRRAKERQVFLTPDDAVAPPKLDITAHDIPSHPDLTLQNVAVEDDGPLISAAPHPATDTADELDMIYNPGISGSIL